MRKIYSIFVLLFVAILLFPADAEAQYGKKKKRRDKEEENSNVRVANGDFRFFEKVWLGLNIGNPNVNNQFLTLGVGPTAAYKFNRFLSAGVITDINYTYVWNRGATAENYIDYSVGVFGRGRFLQQFYGHVEYNLTSLDRATSFEPRSNFPVLFLGGGYTSGRPPWGFEATLLFDVLGNLSQFRIPFVYRIGVTYAF